MTNNKLPPIDDYLIGQLIQIQAFLDRLHLALAELPPKPLDLITIDQQRVILHQWRLALATALDHLSTNAN